ncbi:hypothetical protein GCM10007874_24180 [Labrys miyagiensis]|uniref:DUF4132 domain-containing protein n=1 Tax=Labrys miyagiensis TaxID=346912 RepID=A0ABQ6CMB8_9HYPH|nr:DUF4132 domain-containing protein [Labrys miyagiensis]GLS19401.1 hypothetical protein GCM10007874_24180 [Labrys miyagiensis]
MFDFLKAMIGGRKSSRPAAADGASPLAPANALPRSRPDATTAQEITLDLKRLESISPDLAKRTLGYVLTGDGGSVLLQLEQQSNAVGAALARHHYQATPGLQKTNEAAVKARDSVLGRKHGPDAIWIRRYLEVLTLSNKGSRWGVFAHTGPSPFWLRGLFGNGQSYSSSPAQMPTNLTTALNWRDPGDSATVFAVDLLVLEKVNRYYFQNFKIASRYDFKTGLLAERPAVIESFAKYERPAQAAVIDILKQFDLVRDEYFDFIYQQYLTSTSKAVRESAQNALLASPSETLAASAAKTLDEGNPTARAQAAQILPLVLGDRARSLLEAHLEKETAKSVRKVIELGLGSAVVVADGGMIQAPRSLGEDGAAGYLAADGSEVLTPPLVPPPASTPLPDSVIAGYRKLLDQEYTQKLKQYEHQRERYEQATADQRKNWWQNRTPTPPKPVDYAVADRYCAALMADHPIEGHKSTRIDISSAFSPHGDAAAAAAPFNDPAMTLWHLSRAMTLQAINFRTNNPGWAAGNILSGWSAVTAAMHARLTNGLDLRSLTTLMPELLEANALALQVLTSNLSEDLGADLVWPYLAGHFDVLDQAIGQAASTLFREPQVEAALARLRLFPKLPARYFNTVLTHALSTKKALNQPARALLLGIEGIEKRLLPFLSDGKQDVRAGVAQMLGSIGAETTIEPIKERLAKEKSELVRAALLRALRQLNVDISFYVTPKILTKEAADGLKARKAKDVAWLALDALPALSWAKGGAVPAEVPRWWITLAAKLAQPGGNDLFSLWLDQLAPASAEAFGRYLLGSFLRYDAAHCSEEAANAYAKANAQKRYEQFQEYAKRWNSDYYRSYTYEKAFADLRASQLSIYLNNAHADRGILGLAARVEGTHAVQLVRAYMRDHYKRTAQVKALTDYLSGNPSSATLQMLLSIARRHRTNAVQVLAGELVERISDDRGWTADELADRTIPTAGLDENGILDLEIGSRVYQAKLDAEDTLTLYNPDGKIVQNLPQVKEGPDKESAAEAKKALSNARKELKQVHEFQAKRLYEALCVSRRWPVADWQRYLLEHPIVGRLVQRLVWLGLDEKGKILAAFRPLEDLSLTDNTDGTVDPTAFATIQLAHRSLLSEEDSAAWKEHLADYKVEPLFNQFDRPLLAGGKGTSIDDRQGCLIEAFKLRGAANKLGYERSQAEDGGWFTQYLKSFGTIGITAAIEFTGSPLPEENRAVALVDAKFVRNRKGRRSGWGRDIPLNEVPPVLLSEVWNDFHQIAGAGNGFAADWQKKVGW